MFGRTVRLCLCSINDTLSDTLLALEVIHDHGHMRHNARDIMPSGAAQEDTNQLNRVSFMFQIIHYSDHPQLSLMNAYVISRQKRLHASKKLIVIVSLCHLFYLGN